MPVLSLSNTPLTPAMGADIDRERRRATVVDRYLGVADLNLHPLPGVCP
ncbi:hypothetical protein ACIQFZ_25835 [Streptomyces sp. NPDC093064]